MGVGAKQGRELRKGFFRAEIAVFAVGKKDFLGGLGDLCAKKLLTCSLGVRES